jgi:hypothetical protein
MSALIECIESLQARLEKHRNTDLKETPTRTIFIDPLLLALGWDVRNSDDVELEYPTIDGKSVDYAAKINDNAVLLIEAKSLNDPLTDVRAITQAVGYAANDGIEECFRISIPWNCFRFFRRSLSKTELLKVPFTIVSEGNIIISNPSRRELPAARV